MPWQRQAIEKWNVASRRGIVKVATGAGKTYMALSIIRELPRVRVAIVVPTIQLMRQWATKIEQELGIGRREIGFFYGEEHQELRPITIFVVNTAAKLLEKVHRRNPFSLIIYDECHHYGAPSFCTVLEPNIRWKLGLSATPERLNDPDGTKLLKENIGPIVFTYGLKEAIEDGILAHFDLIKVFTYFNGREVQKYIKLSRGMERLIRRLKHKYIEIARLGNDIPKILDLCKNLQAKDKDARILLNTVHARRMMTHSAENKLKITKRIIKANCSNSRIMVFSMSIKFAERIYKYCATLGATIYHSQYSNQKRTQALEQYRKGEKNILVACMALDEGFDVPSTDIAIIAAQSKSVRQFIQRSGRVLRRKEDGKNAKIYLILIEGYEDPIFEEIEEAADSVLHLDHNFSEISMRHLKKIEQRWISFPLRDSAVSESRIIRRTKCPKRVDSVLCKVIGCNKEISRTLEIERIYAHCVNSPLHGTQLFKYCPFCGATSRIEQLYRHLEECRAQIFKE